MSAFPKPPLSPAADIICDKSPIDEEKCPSLTNCREAGTECVSSLHERGVIMRQKLFLYIHFFSRISVRNTYQCFFYNETEVVCIHTFFLVGSQLEIPYQCFFYGINDAQSFPFGEKNHIICIFADFSVAFRLCGR